MRLAVLALLLGGCAPALTLRPSGPAAAATSLAAPSDPDGELPAEAPRGPRHEAAALRILGALRLRDGQLDLALAHLDASRALVEDPRTVALMVEAHVRAGRLLVAGELCTDMNIEHPALDVICGVAALRLGEHAAVTAMATRDDRADR
jgi:hypothetical protein